MTRDKLSATCYLQVEPEWYHWRNSDGTRDVRGCKVVRVSQKKPTKPVGGTVTLKLQLNIPAAVFLPLEPSAEVDFSMSEVVLNRGDVVVEGQDANDE